MTRSLAAALLGAALLAAAGARSEPLAGPDLVGELSGNTLTGFNGSIWFSEYHLPDGRVFGHNGGVPVQGGCWKVRGDAVCYYYPRDRSGGQDDVAEFCWRFERAGSAGYRISLVGRLSNGLARREAGNAHDFGDNGQPWTCDAQVSGLPPDPERVAGMRHASGPR